MDFPVATEVTLPIRGNGHQFLPVLLQQVGNDVFVDRPALLWSRELTLALSLPSIQQRIKTITRFKNFYALFSAGQSFNIEEQTHSIYAYLDWRLAGTVSLSPDRRLSKLGWRPVQKETARNEFRHIVEYFIFLSKYNNDSRFVQFETLSIPSRLLKKIMSDNHDDFFKHLKFSRDYWADHSPDNPQVPLWGRPDSGRSGYRPFPTWEEVREIISAEKNPIFRAVWIAAAFGSHRISELLNVWQIDVLPGSYRTEFFEPNMNSDMVLLLLAHPSESTYVDQPGEKNAGTRQKALETRYNLTPRNLLPERHPLRSGWKSKLFTGFQKTANTFWLDQSAEAAFTECAKEIKRFHLLRQTSRYHPYFFVNMYSKDDTFGEPLRMARIQKAWVAACKRVGVQPHVRGRNIHGLRHFAKWFAESELKLSQSNIQIIRGDRSINSQNEYARCALSVNEVMSANALGKVPTPWR